MLSSVAVWMGWGKRSKVLKAQRERTSKETAAQFLIVPKPSHPRFSDDTN